MTNDEAIYVLKNTAWLGSAELVGDVTEAVKMAVEALKRETSGDAIDRQAAIRIASGYCHPSNVAKELAKLPSVQPEPSEITDEQAILHLQSTGWMQNHDREMYESGLRERLADDSGDYDSLIPCEDAISRADAIDALSTPHGILYPIRTIEALPSVQPDIIVCADCKHWVRHDRRCGYWNHGVKPLEWCCHAERKENR